LNLELNQLQWNQPEFRFNIDSMAPAFVYKKCHRSELGRTANVGIVPIMFYFFAIVMILTGGFSKHFASQQHF
jgi:hypothetical protein